MIIFFNTKLRVNHQFETGHWQLLPNMDEYQAKLETAIQHMYDTRNRVQTRQRRKTLQKLATAWNLWMESAVSNGNTGEETAHLLNTLLESPIDECFQ